MTKFCASKEQLKSLLVMLICSIVIGVVGIYFLVYYANHFCDAYIKIAGYLFIIGSVCFLISTILNYLNTTLEVIINDDFICINKPGFNEVSSQIINYSDIVSVSCKERELLINHRTVTTIEVVTKMGTKIINNIENAGKCTKIINDRITTEVLQAENDVVKKSADTPQNVQQEIDLRKLISKKEPTAEQLKCPYCGNIQSNKIIRCLQCSKIINEQ